MKTVLRLTLVLLFCVILCLCLAPGAWGEDFFPLPGIIRGDFTLPANTKMIDDEAFSGCGWMKTVTIPAGVTRIGNNAFSGCINLDDVYYGGTQEQWGQITIGTGNDALTQATLHCTDSHPVVDSGIWGVLTWKLDDQGTLTISGNGEMDDFTDDSEEAWRKYKTNICSVVIDKGVTSIGYYAFYNCSSMTSVTIPDSVTSIRYRAFDGCSGLTSVTIPDSVTYIDIDAFWGCSGLTSVTIPGSVTSIRDSAFYGCSGLTSVIIPDSLSSIDYGTFWHCSGLTSVTIPNSVKRIGDLAFCGCSGLTSVTIPNSVTSIGDSAFDDCSGLTSVTIPDGVTSIGKDTFYNCTGLTSVTIPDSVTSIGEAAFRYCSGLTSVTIPDSVSSIDNSAFNSCSGLTSVTIPDSVTSIGNYVFYHCSGLTSVTIPDSVTSIGDSAFNGCSSLTSVTIPDGVTSIGDNAFFGCTSLKSVTIPGSLTRVGAVAFGECRKLEAVYYSGDASQWKKIYIDDSRDGDQNNNYYFVSAARYYNCDGPEDEGKKTMFGIMRQGDGWALRWVVTYQEQDGQAIDPELTIRMDGVDTTDTWKYTFSETNAEGSPWLTETGFAKTAFKKITIRGTTQNPLHIINHQFYGYTGVTDVFLSHVIGIDNGAFENCTSLALVNGFDSDLETIAPAAFKNDVKLRILYGDNYAVNLKYIGDEAFMNTKLMSFNFCNSIEEIGSRAFYNAILGSITLGRNVEEIGAEAFAGNLGLTIYCYRDSEALWYAEREGIAYVIILEPYFETTFTSSSPNIGNAMVRLKRGFDFINTDSSIFDYELALTAVTLSAQVYKNAQGKTTKEILYELGYDTADFKNGDSSFAHPGVCFGYKRIGNGKNLFTVVVRGTDTTDDLIDVWTDLQDGALSMFRVSGEYIEGQLEAFMVDETGKTKAQLQQEDNYFLFTGHSLGGAVANYLSINSNIMGFANSDRGKIYTYTFESPHTCENLWWTDPESESNAFNYKVDGDAVTNLPPYIGSTTYGKDVWIRVSELDDELFNELFPNSICKTLADATSVDGHGNKYGLHDVCLDLIYVVQHGEHYSGGGGGGGSW